MLAMVTLLQAYGQVGDAEAVVTAKMDKRWQLVLGTLHSGEAPFSQGVLPKFRQRLAEHDLDRKLLARTVELAQRSGAFGWQKLKVALDSSPLLGAGRVEDTWNLIGRALSTVVDCAAKALEVSRQQVLEEAALTLLSTKSLKAELDIDWDDPAQRTEAMQRLLAEVEALQQWVHDRFEQEQMEQPLKDALEALKRVLEQDLEPDPQGGGRRIRRGVAKDRMPSLGDKEARHGRKSKSKPFVGYKRHVARAVGHDLILAAEVLPANTPEQQAAEPLVEEATKHGEIGELLIDRGYLSSPVVDVLWRTGRPIRCRPWPSRNAGRYTKEDFVIDLDRGQVICPQKVRTTITPSGRAARFPASKCANCPSRALCTKARLERGRSISIHPQERLLLHLRAAKKTSEGRSALRERIGVEHSLASLGRIQGRRARYKGVRKNSLDLRRCSTVANLQTISRHWPPASRRAA
jgi:hypothetical protein